MDIVAISDVAVIVVVIVVTVVTCYAPHESTNSPSNSVMTILIEIR